MTSEHRFKGPVGDTVICLSISSFSLTYREITLGLEREEERAWELVRERERDSKGGNGRREGNGENGMEGKGAGVKGGGEEGR